MMIANKSNGALFNEMGTDSTNFKLDAEEVNVHVEDVNVPRKCFFKYALAGLLVIGTLICAVMITWFVAKDAYQPESSAQLDSDIVTASYVLSKMNQSVDPCTDFFQYACGGWIKEQWQDNIYILYDEMAKSDLRYKSYLLEPYDDSTPISYKNVKITYQSCLGNHKANDSVKLGSWLDEIFDLSTAQDILEYAGHLGVYVFFEITILESLELVFAAEFLNLDESTIEAFLEDQPGELAQKDNIVNFKKWLNNYESSGSSISTPLSKIIKSTEFVNASAYFETFGLSSEDEVMASIQLVEDINSYIVDNIEEIERINFMKSFVGLHIQNRFNSFINHVFDEDSCDSFFATTYFGYTIGSLTLGRENIDYNETLESAQQMVTTLTEEYRQSIEESDWLSEQGKQRAVEKLEKMQILVGMAHWINNDTHLRIVNYSGELDADMSFVEIFQRINKDMMDKMIAKVLHGRESQDPWELTFGPQIALNALYYQGLNTISIPIGAFIPPYYHENWSTSMKYGALGSIIAHEMTHGFDRTGMEYDGEGKRVDWWLADDRQRMQENQQCFVKQYNDFGHFQFKVNGDNTLDENLADNGGLYAAYKGYRTTIKESSKVLEIPGMELTSDQMFFLSFAQMRCFKYTEETLAATVYGDDKAYSPPDFRLIGSIQSSNAFSEAFSCPISSEMNPATKCSIW